MSSYPTDYLYTAEHEWLKIDDRGDDVVVTLGITEHAQSELGEVVFVDLPEVDAVFASSDEIGSIESVKAVAEIYSPVSGTVIEVNPDLDDAPEVVNQDPHGKGWLCKLRVEDNTDFSGLMNVEAYEASLPSDG